MVFIEGERIKLKDPNSIEHVTIFKITGECLYDKVRPIDGYLDIEFLGNETLLAVINTKSRINQIVKMNRTNVFLNYTVRKYAINP